MPEAQAIAIEMEKIVSSRPMTHDLFKSFNSAFDIELQEVIISNLKEGVFFAKIICSFADGSNMREIDARPSDAIAIGLRQNVPIYASEEVMSNAGILLDEQDEYEGEEEGYDEEEETAVPVQPEVLSDYSNRELEEMLQEAIDAEEYERAAKIRDEMSKRE
jgi:bifunctional DNase/RNase